ncbi:hypothetical protein [Kineosporia sp. A_224]|uniref:hypothetical protein n=1 Tax=Kineosporia sp. A_224 TaxID=1962180 RepID=UPI001179BEB6|nr:hypothetical protein [Kineosporia sp. A_224]
MTSTSDHVQDSRRTGRLVGRLAWWAAWTGLVLGQIHALSRFATADGREDLRAPLVRLWAVPASEALRPLLDWSGPDRVYLTYGKIWLPVFAAFTLCAVTTYRARRPRGAERWTWRLAITGYLVAVLGVALDYWTQWGAHPTPFLETAFLVSIGGLLLTLLGSTALGIALLRGHFRPAASAWLLALCIPIAVAILQVTSLGNAALPQMFAFALIGRQFNRPAPETDGDTR